jgi:energy-coupling factor transporter ATP-binding protein EcfA2
VLRNIIHPEKRILLLDEPTISLDPNIKEYMLNIILNTKNKTVVVITHDSDCLKVVDRVISFDKA